MEKRVNSGNPTRGVSPRTAILSQAPPLAGKVQRLSARRLRPQGYGDEIVQAPGKPGGSCNRRVGGSSPPPGAIIIHMRVDLLDNDRKTVAVALSLALSDAREAKIAMAFATGSGLNALPELKQFCARGRKLKIYCRDRFSTNWDSGLRRLRRFDPALGRRRVPLPGESRDSGKVRSSPRHCSSSE